MEQEDEAAAPRDKADAEAEAAAAAAKSARLDMSHGFVRHIRRNQIARDDYDREVRQAKERQKKRQTPAPVRPRKPDQQVYHPRRKNGVEYSSGFECEESNESSSGTDQEPPAMEHRSTELFCLDYQADDKIVTSVVIHQGDQNCSQYSDNGRTKALYSRNMTSPLLHSFYFNEAKRACSDREEAVGARERLTGATIPGSWPKRSGVRTAWSL
ncbi:UPF0561 protein C2orf68 homolog isoform X1 [Chiloscyllium plagiosum]|uniref:UPF0561 protein C2orf68 homolog isoform X1 n=1 Tax=Chiloscyllium plagiosum TaxID=36176 RepID=UPI001CB889D5|nr:UPF0561 protein C2orf68 homolog isoform X1 [Chiloscyllium plagiosum]